MDVDPTLRNVNQPGQEVAGPFKMGQLLDGKYEILSLLGQGGMGTVYRVKHILLGVELALKTLDIQRVGDATSSRRFQTEAKAAFSLKHPNLVKVHDFGVLEDGQPFLVMDLVEGKTLQTFIKERGQLSLSEIEAIFVQLCFGLAHAHQQQVVHRDIKPANIMLTDGVALNVEGSVKVLDFGIAKIVDSDRNTMEALTMTGEVFGSPLYMSPEQCSGGTIDQRSDVYSLGCVLFEALTGTPPLVGTNPLRTMMLHVNDRSPSLKEAALGSEFPESIEQIVSKMLAKSPADRYSDLGVVALELSRACSNKDHRSTEDTPIKKTVQKQPVAAGSIAVKDLMLIVSATAIIAILGTLLGVQLLSHHETSQQNSGRQNASKNGTDGVQANGQQTDEHQAGGQSGDSTKLNGDDLSNNPFNNDRSEARKMAKKAFETAPKVSVSYEIRDGVRQKKVVFPDYTMGTIIAQYPTGSRRINALGVQYLPANSPITLAINSKLNPEVLENSFIFDKVDPDLINSLVIEFASQANPSNAISEVTPEMTKGLMHLITSAARFNKLFYLSLRDIDLTHDQLTALCDLPHVQSLALDQVTCDTDFLAHLSLIQKLTGITVQNGDMNETVKMLSHSPNIQWIELGPQVGISADSVKTLKNAASLTRLSFDSPNVDKFVVEAASNLRQVELLSFEKGALNQTEIANLQRKGLRQIPMHFSPLAFSSTNILFGRKK